MAEGLQPPADAADSCAASVEDAGVRPDLGRLELPFHWGAHRAHQQDLGQQEAQETVLVNRPLAPGCQLMVALGLEDLFGGSAPDPAHPGRGAAESACPKKTSAGDQGAAESACPSARAGGWSEQRRLAEQLAVRPPASAPIAAVPAEHREEAQSTVLLDGSGEALPHLR